MILKTLRPSALLVTLMSAALFTSAAYAAPVATVNGSQIPQSMANAFTQDLLAQGQKDTPELRNAVRENLIMRELIVQNAKKLGIDKNPEIQTQMKIADQSVLVRAFEIAFAQQNPVSDNDLKEAYKQASANAPKEELKIRAILVSSESKAKDIISRLDSGDDFAMLAKQNSIDAQAQTTGGDLGWVQPSGPLGNAITKLGKGKYTKEPIKSEAGWNVVLVEDRRPFTVPPFDQVKQQLAQDIQAQRFQQYMAKQRASAKIQ